MRSALVVPRHRIGLGRQAAGGHGGQHVLVDILAEHGAASMTVRCHGVSAAAGR